MTWNISWTLLFVLPSLLKDFGQKGNRIDWWTVSWVCVSTCHRLHNCQQEQMHVRFFVWQNQSLEVTFELSYQQSEMILSNFQTNVKSLLRFPTQGSWLVKICFLTLISFFGEFCFKGYFFANQRSQHRVKCSWMGTQTPYGPVRDIFNVVQLTASEGAHNSSKGPIGWSNVQSNKRFPSAWSPWLGTRRNTRASPSTPPSSLLPVPASVRSLPKTCSPTLGPLVYSTDEDENQLWANKLQSRIIDLSPEYFRLSCPSALTHVATACTAQMHLQWPTRLGVGQLASANDAPLHIIYRGLFKDHIVLG